MPFKPFFLSFKNAAFPLFGALVVGILSSCNTVAPESAQPIVIVTPPIVDFTGHETSASMKLRFQNNTSSRILVDTIYSTSPGITVKLGNSTNTKVLVDSLTGIVISILFDWEAYRNLPDPRIVFQTDYTGYERIEISVLVPSTRTELQLSGTPGTGSRLYNIPVKFSPNNSLILYHSQLLIPGGGRKFEVFTMNVLGENRQQITRTPDGDSFGADLSANGTRVLFYTKRADGSSNMYIWTPGGIDTLTRDLFQNIPVGFNADGTRVLFNSNRSGNKDAYYFDLSNRRVVSLSANPYPEEAVCWSTDGNRVLIKSYISNQWDVAISTLIGQPLRVTTNAANDIPVAFSPDGNRILFFSDRNFRREVFTMALNGSDIVQLTNNQLYDYPFRYFPDGSRILYQSISMTNYNDLFLIDARGGQQSIQRLTAFKGSEIPVDISSDGKVILYYSERAPGYKGTDIFTTRTDVVIGL